MTQVLRVGVFGAGVFGTYHARKVAGSKRAVLVGVYDQSRALAERLAEETGSAAYDSAASMMANCDAVMVATPAHTHFVLADAALRLGKHVLVEKPLALAANEANALVTLAEDASLILQVGHQERLVCDALGLFGLTVPIERLEFTRYGLPPEGGRAMDVSVIWDLMIHDIDLAHCLLGERADGFDASGICELGTELDSVQAGFEIGGVPVTLKASRLASSVERTVHLTFADGVIDVDFGRRSVQNTSGLKLNSSFADDLPDPLGAADEAFFAACLGLGATPISGRSAAFAVATAKKLETIAKQS